MAFYPAINCIKFIDTVTGYVVGDNYGMRKTTNRGNSWFVPGFNDIGEYEIDLHGAGYGFAAGTSLKLDKTQNGYDNWQRLIMNDNFVDVSFVNEQVGYIVGTTYTVWPFFKTTDGGESWFTVPNYPDSIMGNLSTVNFLDSLNGFLGGAKLAFTTDGGESWDTANGITNSITKVFFINRQKGWAAAGNGIFGTNDGGNYWIEQVNSGTDAFTSMYFVDSLNGWATSRYIWETTNSGQNWFENTNVPFTFSTDIYFPNLITGWIARYSSVFPSLYKSTDSGLTWNEVQDVLGAIKFHLFPDPTHWFINGIYFSVPKVYLTNDEGNTWLDITTDVSTGFTKFNSVSDNLGYAVGNLGLILKYNDTTYTPVELSSFSANAVGQDVLLKWVTLTETNNKGFEINCEKKSKSDGNSNWKKVGFIGGYGTTTEKHSYSFTDKVKGTGIFYYKLKQIDFNGEYKWSNIIKITVNPPRQYDLSQNYPNPFNPSTSIKYDVPKISRVTLKIYDILGREVITLVNNEVKNPGSYLAVFKASHIASGVYLLRLQADDYVNVKKMILLK